MFTNNEVKLVGITTEEYHRRFLQDFTEFCAARYFGLLVIRSKEELYSEKWFELDSEIAQLVIEHRVTCEAFHSRLPDDDVYAFASSLLMHVAVMIDKLLFGGAQ